MILPSESPTDHRLRLAHREPSELVRRIDAWLLSPVSLLVWNLPVLETVGSEIALKRVSTELALPNDHNKISRD